MEKSIISEELIKDVFNRLLSEETSKVRREDYSKVQYKLEELENSLGETIKEFRKLQDSIPSGLKTITNGRINGISNGLSNTDKLVKQLKFKVKQHKKSTFTQQVEEKKN
jgi:hypothetical protein